MRIVVGFPPLFDEIDAKFHVRGRPVLFCFGDIIYDPTNAGVPAHLVVHEAAHRDQQGDDVMGWWRRYIDDAEFRLSQEIPAHLAEYRALMGKARDRNHRRWITKEIAKRLSGPLYGGLINETKALRLLKGAA